MMPVMVTSSVPLGRPFWTFWSASTLANVGDGIRLAAFPLLAASLTANPIAVAAVAAAKSLPWLVTGLLAGSLVTAAVAAADSAWFAILVLYAEGPLGIGATGFGILLTAGALGGLLGSFIVDRLVAGRRHRMILTCSLATTAGIPAMLAVTTQLWAAILAIVITSGSFAVLNVTVVSLRQRLVPRELLGRTIAAGRTLSFSAAAGGALLGGVLTATIGIEAPFIFSGLVAVLATAAWWVVSRPTPS
ncbi:MFS transporter [Salinispora cortesiana]|uniref:MFS transporter n=1 Tax=Salinispora cortesiana TaxID=1305843 RepID=UPI0003FE9311|nr:MFS transporter [Salinispora cortesiana]